MKILKYSAILIITSYIISTICHILDLGYGALMGISVVNGIFLGCLHAKEPLNGKKEE